jgi:hypothetical protein
MVSESAERLLAALRAADKTALCLSCAGVSIHAEPLGVLHLVGELFGTRDVLADYRPCPACGQRDLVVRLRKPQPSS